jgi:hypothetical protein
MDGGCAALQMRFFAALRYGARHTVPHRVPRPWIQAVIGWYKNVVLSYRIWVSLVGIKMYLYTHKKKDDRSFSVI